MATNGIEIERRYLLDGCPSPAELAELGARPRLVEQVYLRRTDDWVRRVRRVTEAGTTHHIATRKRDAAGFSSGIAREEIEEDLTAEEYDARLADADPERRMIRKVRHRIAWDGRTLELDVFSEPPDLVLLEVELDDPADVPALPAVVAARVVREVTDEVAFTNYQLALGRPEGAAGGG